MDSMNEASVFAVAIPKSDRLGFPIELAARLLNIFEVFRCLHPYPAKGRPEAQAEMRLFSLCLPPNYTTVSDGGRQRTSTSLSPGCAGDGQVGRDFGRPGPSCSMMRPTRANKRKWLPSWLIPHRHRPRAELQPAHEPQVDMLR